MTSRSLQLDVSPQAISLSSLMLMGSQKSLTLFDFFEKNSSLSLDKITQVETRQLGCISQRNNR